MIRVKRHPEPPTFNAKCRKRGRAWLAANSVYERPKDFWSQFEPELRTAFDDMCGYCAMVVMKAQVDHFIPVAELKRRGQDQQAYEWNNFRYGEGILNQRKSAHLVLDPFKVKDDWFDLLLPSLQLVLTSKVPNAKRKLAEFTLDRLGLKNSEVVVRYRELWFRMYRQRKLTINGLVKVAPVIARAVARDLKLGIDWRI
jgi:hypothetical protein